VRLEGIPPRDGCLLGIDVSQFQAAIDWARLPPCVRFAFIRATCGLKTDVRFEANAAACRVPWGAYHALAYGSDPVEQAQRFVRVVGGRGELPMVLDFEVARPGEKASECVARAVACLREIERLTKARAIVYTYPTFAQRLMDLGADLSPLAQRPLWIAHYITGRKTPLLQPTIPRAWSTWYLWQFAGGGHAKLANGADVDVNWFRGTEAELAALGCYGE
jgi:GH25 family lysozyme M1 (1,4-beta-N-acetylmuramidase)